MPPIASGAARSASIHRVSDDGPFADPALPGPERTAYRGLVDGREFVHGWIGVEPSSAHYLQTLEAELGDDLRIRSELRFLRRRGRLLAERFKLETTAGARPVGTEHAWFRDVKVLRPGAALRPYPRSITPVPGCALALRGLELTGGTRHRFSLWLAGGAWWEVEAHVERRERVEVPAGALDAWRVRLHPRFDGMGPAVEGVIAAVMPPIVLHLAADAPRRLLRAEFPTGPFPGNPRALVEATEL